VTDEEREEKRERNIAKAKQSAKHYLLVFVLIGMLCCYVWGYVEGKYNG